MTSLANKTNLCHFCLFFKIYFKSLLSLEKKIIIYFYFLVLVVTENKSKMAAAGEE